MVRLPSSVQMIVYITMGSVYACVSTCQSQFYLYRKICNASMFPIFLLTHRLLVCLSVCMYVCDKRNKRQN